MREQSLQRHVYRHQGLSSSGDCFEDVSGWGSPAVRGPLPAVSRGSQGPHRRGHQAGSAPSSMRARRALPQLWRTADRLHARMRAIGCGYPDGNDFDRLRFDPAFKSACGRLPVTGADLCSLPTISRWANAPSLREIIRLTYLLVDIWCRGYAKPPNAVVLDSARSAIPAKIPPNNAISAHVSPLHRTVHSAIIVTYATDGVWHCPCAGPQADPKPPPSPPWRLSTRIGAIR
jgi:hypothetical protein